MFLAKKKKGGHLKYLKKKKNENAAYILFSNFQTKAENTLSPVMYFADFAD